MDGSDHGLAALAPHLKLAFASFWGGVLRLFLRPVEGESFFHAVAKSMWMLFGCVTCGYYFTPVIMGWWGVGGNYTGAVGALLGFVGLSIAEGILAGVDGINVPNILRFFLKQPNDKLDGK